MLIATTELAPFEEVNLFYDEAAESLGLSDGIREMLRRPWRELGVQVPVRMDDGRIEVFNGYRPDVAAVLGFRDQGDVWLVPRRLPPR